MQVEFRVSGIHAMTLSLPANIIHIEISDEPVSPQRLQVDARIMEGLKQQAAMQGSMTLMCQSERWEILKPK